MDHQTFAQLLGNYGEFIGAIAAVATLLYLAVQIRQGKEATEANTRSVEESRRVALVDSYVRRLEAMDRAHTQLALSDQLSDIVRRPALMGLIHSPRLSGFDLSRVFTDLPCEVDHSYDDARATKNFA